MQTLPSTLAALALLFATSCADAAPAPETAQRTLQALKKRLPGVLKKWAKSRIYSGGPFSVRTVLRRLRATGPAEAKVTVGIYLDTEKEKAAEPDYLLTVFLKYHAGLWTAVRFEWSSTANKAWLKAAHFLLDAIDEAAAK
jgi:hypothetical protein